MEVRRSAVVRPLVFGLWLVLSASSAQAHSEGPIAYELYQPENADYRDWTEAELRTRIGADAEALPHYLCDGKREFANFDSPFRVNSAHDSLRVRAKSKDEVRVYREGNWFDLAGAAAKPPKDEFFAATKKALAELEKLPSGRRLLRELEASPYTLTIEQGRPSFAATIPGGKTYSGMHRAQAIQTFVTRRAPDYPTIPMDALGSGGSIFFSLTGDYTAIESDGEIRPTAKHIILGHEMYHAYDGIRGLLDRRFVYSDSIQQTEVTELRATFFENVIRKESGVLYKKYYGSTEQTGPGVLDVNGQPIRLPSPCLPGSN